MPKAPRPLNPFYSNDAVQDSAMFFGREDEVRMLLNAVDKRQCCSLVGSRHIGKSTLLRWVGEPEIQRRVGYELSDRIFIYTDWREFLQRTQEDFYRIVCERIIAECAPVLPLQLQVPVFNIQEQFKKLLEDVRKARYRPVLLMDVFDTVTMNPNFDQFFFTFLRSLAGITDLITYIIATRRPLHEVCSSDEVASSPFFNIFYETTLGPLAPDDARQLITVPAQSAGCAFSDEEVEWVLESSGRHPFFIQTTCRHLFDAKCQATNGEAEPEVIEPQVYEKLVPHFDRLWGDLNEEQKEYFKLRIARGGSNGEKCVELSESGLFIKRVHELLLKSASMITPEEVKSALDNFYDDEFLKASSLSKMHYVAMQLKGTGALSSTQVGNIVRKFLQDAHACMKPSGTRSDVETDWRLYNVLWYRYFKHHMTGDKVAARLVISRRQYHREQGKAIRQLWRMLLDMEAASLGNKDAQT